VVATIYNNDLDSFVLEEGENYKLLLGDTFKILEKLPEKSVDVIFADPPYNLSNDGLTVHAGRFVSVNKGDWDRSKGIDTDFKFHSDWIRACKRVLRDDGTIWISGTYHNIYACGFALQEQGWHILNDIVWFKPNAAPNLSCRVFTASHETLIWARKFKDAKHLFNYSEMKESQFIEDSFKRGGKQMRSVWSIGPPTVGEKRYGKHPTQKPEALLDRIIRASTAEGMFVLDPFCGSGTTGVAALSNARKFIGIDANSDFLKNIAAPRLRDADQPNLLRYTNGTD